MNDEIRSGCSFCKSWAVGTIPLPIGRTYCSMSCSESELFGQGRCRWCGEQTEKPYGSIESRLCSENCRALYWKHVGGDRTAALGTGKRYLAWLQRNYPREYRAAVGARAPASGFCENPCTRGEDGQPGTLTHLRAGARFCSDLCRQQSKRAA